MSPDPLRIEGTLRSWDDDRGFGFLASPQAADTFAHISAFDGRPREGERFSYVIGLAADGRAQAQKVRAVRKPAVVPRPKAARESSVGVLVIPAFALLFVVLMLRWQLPAAIALIYAAASALTFVVYAVDKLAARAGRQRVSEGSLITLGFVGGWPGGLLAQQLLRHKTAKESFQRQFWQSVMLNVLVVVGLAGALHYGLFAWLSF
jgi:uncharacterized membrane protein YsdA (DUF1294 family)/cold shock CspA family protein